MATREYEPVIGIETHVQLSTRTKMFCGCALSFGDEPNTHTCPICLGHPGTLPVTNAEAVHFALMIAMAFDCEIAPRSIFHRKNYFYPDLPKGYQISQYDLPLARHGRLGDVRIHRVHLEEDAAKLVHIGESGRIHGADASIVDYNRGGTPLCEIVTEPDIHSAEQAREWLTLLRETLRQLGVSDVNMEEGSLRCDANISLRPRGATPTAAPPAHDGYFSSSSCRTVSASYWASDNATNSSPRRTNTTLPVSRTAPVISESRPFSSAFVAVVRSLGCVPCS
mgnify:CR=1 FL=1